MPDETESAVAAWLDSKETQREIDIARKRLIRVGGNPDQAWLLAILVELLANLNIYADPPDIPVVEVEELFPDEDEDDEPWKRR